MDYIRKHLTLLRIRKASCWYCLSKSEQEKISDGRSEMEAKTDKVRIKMLQDCMKPFLTRSFDVTTPVHVHDSGTVPKII